VRESERLDWKKIVTLSQCVLIETTLQGGKRKRGEEGENE